MAKKNPSLEEIAPNWESSADVVNRLDLEPIVDGDPTPETPEHPDESELKKADLVAGPENQDAEGNDPPVRTNRPNVPIIQRLASGAGQHKPLNDPELDADGRLRPDLQLQAALEEQAKPAKTADAADAK